MASNNCFCRHSSVYTHTLNASKNRIFGHQNLVMSKEVKIIECPRDAMQGIKDFIPTDKKVQYLQALLRCGFDTLDFGSFVWRDQHTKNHNYLTDLVR